MKADKIYIVGTGQQAPYGIGEIIAVMDFRYYKEIFKFCQRWYQCPGLRLNGSDGEKYVFDFDSITGKLIGITKGE